MSEAPVQKNRRAALRLVLALAVLVGAGIFVIAGMKAPGKVDAGWFGKSPEPLRAAYPFELTDQNGNAFRLEDQRGSLVLLNFGFTCCPNICPASLANLAAARRALPEGARDRVRVVFVSVDERDDISDLKKYMPMFDEKFTGLTGTPEAIGNTARAYGAFYRKDPKGPQGEEDYLIDHSTSTYLIDPKGNLRLVYKMDQLANAEAMAGDVLRVLGLPQRKD
ncbi:MAG: SCO family protein [Spartobacteria bacterium]